jgi:hypothetical protein
MAMTGNGVASGRANEMTSLTGAEPPWGMALLHDKVLMLGVPNGCCWNAPIRNWNRFSLPGSLYFISESAAEY